MGIAYFALHFSTPSLKCVAPKCVTDEIDKIFGDMRKKPAVKTAGYNHKRVPKGRLELPRRNPH